MLIERGVADKYWNMRVACTYFQDGRWGCLLMLKHTQEEVSQKFWRSQAKMKRRQKTALVLFLLCMPGRVFFSEQQVVSVSIWPPDNSPPPHLQV